MYQRLREGLRRTRERVSQGLGLTESSKDVDWERLEEVLIEADVGVIATGEILEAVRRHRGHPPREALRRELVSILAAAERKPLVDDAFSPRVIMVVGVNGVGKTTTVAKLAHRLLQSGRKPLIVAADTFRAAAIEQLEAWAQRVGAPLVKGVEGSDAAAVVHEGLQAAVSRGLDDVVIDTAGRLHTKRPLMDELAKVRRIAGRLVSGAPHETLLVMDATVGSNGLTQARQFRDAMGLDGIILTKLDGTAKGGVVFAVVRELRLPVVYASVGEGLDDLLPFSPGDFADALLGNGADG